MKNDAIQNYPLRTNIAPFADAQIGTSTNVQKEATNSESLMGQILFNVGKNKKKKEGSHIKI